MSVNDPRVRLFHMLEMAEAVRGFLAGKDVAEFEESLQLQLAVVHALQVIGEAAARTSAEDRELVPDLPWHRMIAFRNLAVHEYFHIDSDEVYRISQESIPELIDQLRPVVGDMDKDL